VSSTEFPHDVVVEDLLWNSLDGNVSNQRANKMFFADLLPRKRQIGGIGKKPSRDTVPRKVENKIFNTSQTANLCSEG